MRGRHRAGPGQLDLLRGCRRGARARGQSRDASDCAFEHREIHVLRPPLDHFDRTISGGRHRSVDLRPVDQPRHCIR